MAAIVQNLLDGFREIFSAPLKDLSIFWLLAPIILFWLIIEIYFGRYKKEKMGWNTALGNGLSMFWIVVISLKVLFAEGLELFSLDKLIFVIFIAVYSIFVIIISFNHRLNEGLFFLLSSPTVVYYLSAIAVLWIHNLLAINFWVIIDFILLYIFVLILEVILKELIPAASSEHHSELQLGKI